MERNRFHIGGSWSETALENPVTTSKENAKENIQKIKIYVPSFRDTNFAAKVENSQYIASSEVSITRKNPI